MGIWLLEGESGAEDSAGMGNVAGKDSSGMVSDGAVLWQSVSNTVSVSSSSAGKLRMSSASSRSSLFRRMACRNRS